MQISDNRIEDLCNRFTIERIQKLCTPMITKFGGLYDFDYDDFFSIANDTIFDCAKNYDEEKGDFDIFVLSACKRKFKTEMTRRNRKKRISSKYIDRLDEVDDDGNTLGSKTPSAFVLEENIDELSSNNERTDRVNNFLSGISKKNKKIVVLIMEGYKVHEILEILDISMKEYNDAISEFKAYRNVRKLFK